MNAPRPSLPPMPKRIARLPRDHRGFPVPWFVAWFKDGKQCDRGVGEPDFRIAVSDKIAIAHRRKLCWTCGEPLGQHLAFLIGPMCAVNRVISEPPSHFECAEFAAKACPFLTQPRMRRNAKDLPDDRIPPPGFGFKRNPGAVCIWVTETYSVFRPDMGAPGVLFRLGPPNQVRWLAEGRAATREEVEASIASGLPSLQEVAALQGVEAIEELGRQLVTAMKHLPPAGGAS
jgi:hypothetical protein